MSQFQIGRSEIATIESNPVDPLSLIGILKPHKQHRSLEEMEKIIQTRGCFHDCGQNQDHLSEF